METAIFYFQRLNPSSPVFANLNQVKGIKTLSIKKYILPDGIKADLGFDGTVSLEPVPYTPEEWYIPITNVNGGVSLKICYRERFSIGFDAAGKEVIDSRAHCKRIVDLVEATNA